MEHDISHIKDIGDIMNIFFNSRIYTNQSFVNALFENNKRLQEVKMLVATVQEIL